MRRQEVISCGVLGGRSPKTGKPVGERHRWSGGSWGVGTCIFCGRRLEEVLRTPAQPLTLEVALQRAEAEALQDPWRPTYWAGEHGIPSGWYVRRKIAGAQWLRDLDGTLLRFHSQREAAAAIARLEGKERELEDREP